MTEDDRTAWHRIETDKKIDRITDEISGLREQVVAIREQIAGQTVKMATVWAAMGVSASALLTGIIAMLFR